MSYLPFGLYYGCRCAKEADVDKLDNPVWPKPNQQAKTELCTHGGNNDFQTTLDVAAPHRVIASIIQSIETYLDRWYASNIYCQLSWLRAEVSWFVTVLLLFL